MAVNISISVLLGGVGARSPGKFFKLGECSALWGEREGVVWCSIVFLRTTFSHLHTSHITIVSFPGLPHLQL